jgi:hypothetical protein
MVRRVVIRLIAAALTFIALSAALAAPAAATWQGPIGCC